MVWLALILEKYRLVAISLLMNSPYFVTPTR
jgi:hypothetical protein